uniref:Uncharacterized protein AlNc14C56G4245 n=1 Tax=Albugo laibachii Nc14 TaxID=890382 RepID=F0WC62_9STRA|nr:hypothetical protein PITG_05283 [Albugo laibachii Nc14]|eukprot:CCA18775.1 hypothetical protein PITG_05283 [Albugo laibachii Nc14]
MDHHPKTYEIKALHIKWLLKGKTGTNRNLERFKARMVACGNEQMFGINFDISFIKDLGYTRKTRDIPSAYMKAPTEKNLDLYSRVSQGMDIQTTKLEEIGVSRRDQVVSEQEEAHACASVDNQFIQQMYHIHLAIKLTFQVYISKHNINQIKTPSCTFFVRMCARM